MKKLLSILLILSVVVLSASGCKTKTELNISDNHPYNILSYESKSDISDIEQIALSGELSKSCVSYKFTYLSDYCEVKAYISIPLSCIESTTPAKCILYNRGGNSNIGFLTDEDTAKICASTNRIVIASQYRGADGGTGTDEFGGQDLNDIIKLIDLCESTFEFTDMTDFCTAGVSRGGMMSYMASRNDERIKGIIAISAVSDLTTAYEERDDMKKLLTNYIGGSPADLPYEYDKRSVICWADEINVPILMIHSKLDEQVSFSQAESLYSEFQNNKLNCTFEIHEDNVHGLHAEDSEIINKWLTDTFN